MVLIRKFPPTLSACACQGSFPTTEIPRDIGSRMGRAQSTFSADPATTIQSLPASATLGRPNTGAATNGIPRRACSRVSRSESATLMVLHEMCRVEGVRAEFRLRRGAGDDRSFARQRFGLSFSPIPHGEFVPGGDQAVSHYCSHLAQSEKTNSHRFDPSLFSSLQLVARTRECPAKLNLRCSEQSERRVMLCRCAKAALCLRL